MRTALWVLVFVLFIGVLGQLFLVYINATALCTVNPGYAFCVGPLENKPSRLLAN